MPPAPIERFAALVDYLRKQRKEAANTLAIGRWEGEPAARELVGKVKALDDALREVANLAGPNFHYDGEDVS